MGLHTSRRREFFYECYLNSYDLLFLQFIYFFLYLKYYVIQLFEKNQH